MIKNYLEIAFSKDEIVKSYEEAKELSFKLLCLGRIVGVVETSDKEWHVIEYKRID